MSEIQVIRGRVYLIAHCSKDRRGLPTNRDVKQARVTAKTSRDALDTFKREHPDRHVTEYGIRGVS